MIADNIIRNNDDDGIEIRMQEHRGAMLNITITRNAIYGNDEDGIQLIHYDVPTPRFIRITHNRIYDNRDAGIGMMDNEESSEDFRAANIPERIHIFNNTIAHNSHGITGGDSTVVVNNIFVGHTVVAIKSVDAGSRVAFNAFFDNRTDHTGSNVDDGSNVYADPQLTREWGLLHGSPAVDAGTATFSWFGTMVLNLGRSEYAGAAPDLGAVELPRSHSP